MNNILSKPISEVAAMLENQDVTALELTEATLERIKEKDGELNAFTYVIEDAREQAKIADREIELGNYRGPLHGIPFSVKDLYYTKNVPTTGGSELLKDFRPDFTAEIVQRLEETGAILIGKNNTHQFAFGATNEESYFGPVHNAWDTTKISGGSSGGSAVAVAAGMSSFALGTDTSGSVRIPTAANGIVGFKPSYGLLSTHGIIPLSPQLDHAGPITRSVYDAALVMDGMTKSESEKKKEVPENMLEDKRIGYTERIDELPDLKGIRLGVPQNFFWDKTDPEVKELVEEGIRNLENLGAACIEVEVPHTDLISDTQTTILSAEAAYIHKEYYEAHPEFYHQGVSDRLDAGLELTAVEFQEALDNRKIISEGFKELFERENLDAIVSPTISTPAFDLGKDYPWYVEVNGQEEKGSALMIYITQVANQTGGPAITYPVGLTQEQLPVGMMLMGDYQEDLKILQIARYYEKQHPFKEVPPSE